MFNKLQIRTRLLASYAIIVIVMIITGVYALNRLDYLASLTSNLYEHPFTVRKSVREATLSFIKMHYKLKDSLAVKDSAGLNANLSEMSEHEKNFHAKMDLVRERFLGKKSDVDDVLRVFEEWKRLM